MVLVVVHLFCFVESIWNLCTVGMQPPPPCNGRVCAAHYQALSVMIISSLDQERYFDFIFCMLSSSLKTQTMYYFVLLGCCLGAQMERKDLSSMKFASIQALMTEKGFRKVGEIVDSPKMHEASSSPKQVWPCFHGAT